MNICRIMNKIANITLLLFSLICAGLSINSVVCNAEENSINTSSISIGNRLEPFVDRFLIESMQNAELRLSTPIEREIVFSFDKPWEGPASAYCTIVKDNNVYRLYYRGYCLNDLDDQQVTCMAESQDGIHFTRSNLQLFDFKGSKDNNIIWRGKESHNFAPFIDSRPDCPAAEKWKALAGMPPLAFVSADGIHWRQKEKEPVLTEGQFDSQNIAFWDNQSSLYRCYSRAWTKNDYGGFRAIRSATSADFIHWNKFIMNQYAADVPTEHFYTNATIPYPHAPYIYLSFPKRFLPERKKIKECKDDGVSDAMFMTSRDGIHWDREFQEAWIRPGLDQRNWTHRNLMTVWGLLELNSQEYSLYHSEHYEWDDARLRRVTVRKDGFASVHAGAHEGVVITKPLIYSGTKLHLNYSTSAAGSIRIEFLDVENKPIPGFSGEASQALYGDSLDEIYEWKGKGDVSPYQGKEIRLKITLRDADLYSIRFSS